MNESVEIRSGNPFEGQFFCGSDIKPGQSLVFSQTNQVILNMQSFDGKSGGTFRAVLNLAKKNIFPQTTSSNAVTSKPTKAGSSDIGSMTNKPTFPSIEGHVDESEEERKDILGFPVDRLIALPLQIITSIIKSVNRGLRRG